MKAKPKVVTTDAQLDSALAQARRFAPEDRRAVAAYYEKNKDRVVLALTNGVEVSIPRAGLQGLEHATDVQAAEIELLGGGTGLHWPQMNVDHYVPGLLNNIFGTAAWMRHVGHLGGSVRSRAKTAAARANGRKGGRPKTAKKSIRKPELKLRAKSA
jgi:hypothetical protein